MVNKMIDKHNECIRLLLDYKKQDSEDLRKLLIEMYTNALISLVRDPIENILEASFPNAVALQDADELILN